MFVRSCATFWLLKSLKSSFYLFLFCFLKPTQHGLKRLLPNETNESIIKKYLLLRTKKKGEKGKANSWDYWIILKRNVFNSFLFIFNSIRFVSFQIISPRDVNSNDLLTQVTLRSESSHCCCRSITRLRALKLLLHRLVGADSAWSFLAMSGASWSSGNCLTGPNNNLRETDTSKKSVFVSFSRRLEKKC